MKILVTGGAGFIGSNFIRYYLEKHPEDQVVNLDKLTYAGHLTSTKDFENNPNYKFIKGDIVNPNDVEEAMDGVDIVVHFAAESHVDRSVLDPLEFVKTNVLGTGQLLQTALKKKVKRFHHVSCYDTETMAFTKNGLKRYDEIRAGDLVLSINPENSELEWKPVEKVIIQDYRGKMIKVRTRTTDLLVSPNHRMLFQRKKTKRFDFKTADSMKKDAINKLPKHYKWNGYIPDKIKKFGNLADFAYILGIFIGDGCLAYQEKITQSVSGLSKMQYLQLSRDLTTGRFVSTGMVGTQTQVISKAWRIFIDVPENDKARKYSENALTNLGINWHAHRGKAGEHIYFTSKEYSAIFKECGRGAKNKKIPDWALNLPPDLLKQVFLGLLDSDGSKRRVFFTSSKTLAHQFMQLCVKLNFSPTLSRRHSRSKYQGRIIEGDSFVVSFGKEWRGIVRDVVKEIDYQGKIWCLKVKDNKNFLTYRNGRTLFCGNTDEVFGSLGLEDSPFNEETKYDPRTPYSASKAGSDHLVRAYFETYGLPVTITNCANNFGPFMEPEKLFARFITNLLEDKKVPLMGKGENIREWLYTKDHGRAIDLVLQKGVVGETYCVGGESKTNLEATKLILKFLGKDESYIEYVADRLGHDFRYAIDDSKIRQLGWKPEHTFEEWLEKTIQWYGGNDWWWKPLKAEVPNLDREVQEAMKY